MVKTQIELAESDKKPYPGDKFVDGMSEFQEKAEEIAMKMEREYGYSHCPLFTCYYVFFLLLFCFIIYIVVVLYVCVNFHCSLILCFVEQTSRKEVLWYAYEVW